MMTEASDGIFPFGTPNTVRPARFATASPRAAVVGVYPSAWHVSWHAPQSARGSGAVAALAVDVEPTVFWNGATDDFSARLTAWYEKVGFKVGDGPGQDGRIDPTSPPLNGSSGRTVVERYLRPLGLEEASVTFTDIYPVFLVKYRSGSGRRHQGDAIRDEYDRVAAHLGRMKASVPARARPSKLPKMAAARFSQRIVDDLARSCAEVVITLGAEVWQALLLIPELQAKPPCSSFNALFGPLYGGTGTLLIAGRKVAWLPLVHPGLLRGKPAPTEVDPRKRTTGGWNTLHARWERSSTLSSASR